MQLFADQGSGATSIRAVAEQAGVAPGLVSHHFGSKQGLRDACDEYVLEYLREIIKQGVEEQAVADPAYLDQIYRSAADVMRYVARALVDGSEGAAALFDSFVALTEEYLAAHPSHSGASQSDPRTRAAVSVAMRLGVWVLYPHLLRSVGAETLTPQLMARLSAAVLDVMSEDFAGADIVALTRTGLARYQQTSDEKE